MTAKPYIDPHCYSCLGTGRIVGFGHTGRVCPCTRHSADCDDACAPDCPSRADDEGFPIRCDCCDGTPDGLGMLHFTSSTAEHAMDCLRRWLASPFRMEDVPLDVDGEDFPSARDAEDWLAFEDRVGFVRRAIEDHLERASGRSL